MRGYFVPLVAGLVLAVSAFLPWVIVSGQSMSGVPDMPALRIVGLGLLASVLALLSLITRKNSRHPLFIIGLVSLGIMFLSWRILPRTAGERALTISQAYAIVESAPMGDAPAASAGSGIFVGLAAAVAIAGFGLTIVIRRVSTPYAVDTVDDDVE
jgi:FtsH-binding integral membrane protein